MSDTGEPMRKDDLRMSNITDIQPLLDINSVTEPSIILVIDFLVTNFKKLVTRNHIETSNPSLVMENRIREMCKFLKNYENWLIVKFVFNEVATTQTEIVGETGVPAPHVSAAVKALIQFGYIEKVQTISNPGGSGNEYEIIAKFGATPRQLLDARDRLFRIIKVDEPRLVKTDNLDDLAANDEALRLYEEYHQQGDPQPRHQDIRRWLIDEKLQDYRKAVAYADRLGKLGKLSDVKGGGSA